MDLNEARAVLRLPAGPATRARLTAIAYDSRVVRPGSLFVAVPGFHVDGHRYLNTAIHAGAAAVVVRRDHALQLGSLPVPVLAVEDTRAALSALSAAFYDHPGRALRVLGVTGTDGKTTTSYLISELLEAGGFSTGLMGTVQFKVGPDWRENDTRQTTPEAPEVHQLLAEMRAAGVTHAVVESSSHGLELHKLDDCAYDAAVVTNVGSDHLELHGTTEAYLAAKGRLFALLDEAGPKPGPRYGVVNADHPRSATHMRARTRAEVRSYGIDAPADVYAADLHLDAGGATFALVTPAGARPVRLPLPGRFNVSNALAAATVAWMEGMDLEMIARALGGVYGPPGRMQRVAAGQPFTVVVDYAHTGPALEKVLETLRPLTAGKLTVLFGCAGGRSPERRAGMGSVAAALADYIVLTNEDPHEEDPAAILAAIAAALTSRGRAQGQDFAVIPDRREAIHAALARAQPGDLVLLAGKGHEQSIISGRTKTAWDEVRVTRAELAALGFSAG